MKLLLLAIRSLTRFRLYTFINVLGLALSLACVIIISRYVYSEWTTDHFNSQHKRMYLTARYFMDGQQPRLFTSANILSQRDYKDPLDIPEIEKQSSFVSLNDVNLEVDDKLYNAHIVATDSLFLQLFDYPPVAGDRLRLLTEPNDAVITSSYARKLFGDEDPVGKTIKYDRFLVTIKGVIGEPSTKSSLHFDLLISQKLQWRWPPVNFNSIALAVPQMDYKKVNEQLKNKAIADSKKIYFQLLPLDELYFDRYVDKGTGVFSRGDKRTLHILVLVGILILFVSLFNFVQLCSAILLKRSRELGMKKVFGARPWQLFLQIYMENFILSLIALILGWSLIEVSKGWQENVLHISVVNDLSFNMLLSISFLFLLPLITSLYPFFIYKYRQTVESLKDNFIEKKKPGFRSFFLAAQYCITLCLIISSLFFMRQLNMMIAKPPGFKTDHIIKAWFERPSSKMSFSDEEIEQIEKERIYIKETVEASALFTGCCYGLSPYEFAYDFFSKRKARFPGGEWKDITFVSVPQDYLKFYDIPVTVVQPTVSEYSIILNETAKKLFSAYNKEPEQIEVDGEESFTVNGFTPEFQTVHLSQLNDPILLKVEQTSFFSRSKLTASYIPGKKQEAIQFLKKLHEETVGGEFSYTFVEDEIKEIYSKDRLISIIYSLFAMIAILISSLGLFSLSLFDVQQRYREIAIRKVNGATTGTIIQFLLHKYYVLLIIAFAIAVPISRLALTKYLEGFAFKAPVSWWLFAIALLITAGISLLTLIWQIRKAAQTNPAEAIKTE